MASYQSPTRMALEATPEVLLVAAVLQQAWHDVTSPNETVRDDAEKFWGNSHAEERWATLIDLDVDALTEAVTRLRQRGAERT
jgi:hypothetical protein